MFQIMICDLRTLTFDVPPQEILTKDSVTVTVDAVVYYKIFSPTFAVINVKNYATSTKLLAATTLRSILGTKTLAEVLSDRESIAKNLLDILDEATDPWGVKVLLTYILQRDLYNCTSFERLLDMVHQLIICLG